MIFFYAVILKLAFAVIALCRTKCLLA